MFSDELVNEVAALRAGSVVNLGDRATFIDNLKFVYYMICATESLLGAALLYADDADYIAYLRDHLNDETDHSEWLAEDIATVTCNGQEVDNLALLHDAARVAGAQYYLIEHESAYALLGYMLVLECFPMSEELVSTLEGLHGTALVRTLRYHSLHDVGHGWNVLHQIDIMPTEYRELVRENALRTVRSLVTASRRFGNVPAVAAHGSADLAFHQV